MISNKYKCLYIHIPKTAGTSIENVMRDYDRPVETGSDHRTLKSYMREIDLNKYFKFTFVRNSYDRIYSIFNYTITGGNRSKGSIKLAQQIPKDFKLFGKKYIANGIDYETIPMLRPQIDYLLDDTEKINIDFIGRFENLNNDFLKIKEITGMTKKLPHTRQRKHDSYKDVYDDELINIIQQAYLEEIEYFNFKF